MSKNNENIRNLITLHGHILSLLEHDSSGIWSRFNILLALNLSLFGFAGFILKSQLQDKMVVIVIVSLIAMFFTIFSNVTINSLWDWHQGWYRSIKRIEKKILSLDSDQSLIAPVIYGEEIVNKLRAKRTFRAPLYETTQFVFLLIFFVWVLVIAFSVREISCPKSIFEILLRSDNSTICTRYN